jgi:hypothetical protein
MTNRTAIALATLLACAATPAFAQESEAPAASDADKINVCARLSEADRYRIPTQLRADVNDPRKEAWTNRVLAYEYVGRDGTMSCSPTGGGGFTGCGLKEIDAAYAEKEQDPGLAFGRMIAAERKKRLAAIDTEAELVEQRVQQFEKERAEREARLQAEADAAAEQELQDGALPQPK